MRHYKFFAFLVVFSFLIQASVKHIQAATITVSPGQSIQSAVNSANAGDTVQIRAGTYNESISVSRSGTASAPIVITGYPGERPVIDGQNSRSSGISIRGSYITVSNLKVTNHTGHDIDVDRSSNVVIDGLEVYITGRALHIQESNNITVKNSTITTPANIARQTDGIYSQRNKNNIYENNSIIIYNSDPTGHDDAIQMYQDDSIIVRGNYLAQVNSKSNNAQGLYATTMYGTSKFYNNVINLGTAQSLPLGFRRLPELGGTGNVEIIGNTVYVKNSYRAIWVTETPDPIIKNNIAVITDGTNPPLEVPSWNGPASNIQNNLLYNPNTTRIASLGSGDTQAQMEAKGINMGGMYADPRLVSIDSKDFHLMAGSPAINAGRTLGSPYNTDKEGKTRPQGSAWDIGAYESNESQPIVKQGDVDNDGKVDIIDIGIIIDNYAKSPIPNSRADVNRDGKVDIVDMGITIDNYGK
jgi:hypothetical protein